MLRRRQLSELLLERLRLEADRERLEAIEELLAAGIGLRRIKHRASHRQVALPLQRVCKQRKPMQ
jgi:hypothetical protein